MDVDVTPLKKVPARFYLSGSGASPVRDWIMTLERADRATVGADIATLEYGWPVGMPLCRSLGQGLWEIRSTLASQRAARIIFCFAEGNLILPHAFMKKTRTTPHADLELARIRMKDVQQ